jgi:hypothetical protein
VKLISFRYGLKLEKLRLNNRIGKQYFIIICHSISVLVKSARFQNMKEEKTIENKYGPG